ncbi:MAG: alpha/beta hydrolase [Anaerolineae bacterium]|nr:alpha/beta hydrolase [Anaerolineae bacterium]
MSTTQYEIQADGHKLIALPLNPTMPGRPIILLHGITASVSFWADLENYHPVFLKHGPCYALSLPGHYPAVVPSNFCQKELTAEMITRPLIIAIRELVGDQPVILVGHSTGGFAALAIAATSPRITSRVISLAGFAQGKWTGLLGTSQWVARKGNVGRMVFKLGYEYSRINPRFNRQFVHWYVADMNAFASFPHFEPFLADTYRNFKHLDLDVMAKYFRTMPDIDISDKLPHIKVPVLVMTGDKDPIVPPTQSHLIAQKIPQAQLEIIKGGGHLLFAENPLEYNCRLDSWLQKTKESRVPTLPI